MNDLFLSHDPADLAELVSSQPLAWIVSGTGADVHATPLPLQLECDDNGRPLLLKGHFGRSNPQWRALKAHPRATVLLLGPHGYVSPSWFRDRKRAPTWNYTAAVFDVDIELRESPADTSDLLGGLVAAMEQGRPAAWQVAELAERYDGLAAHVVGFHAHIRAVRSTFKLGQDEPDGVFDDILLGLQTHAQTALVEWMQRLGKSRPRGRPPLERIEPQAARIDPDIQRFVDAVQKETGHLGEGRILDWVQKRAIAEEVRGPWRRGGPAVRSEDIMATTEAGPVRLRVYDGTRDANKATLVYAHGGGWTVFSLDTHDRVMRELAARAGLAVVGVDYALSPEAKFPVALQQMVGVIDWLHAHGADHDLNTARLGIAGDSAGGNLAVATALKLRDAGCGDMLKAVMTYYGCFAPDLAAHDRLRYGGHDSMLAADEVGMYWRNYVAHVRDLDDPYANVLLADVGKLPPFFMGIAECDVLAEQNMRMAGHLVAAGVPVQVQVYAGASHSFLEAVSVSSIAEKAMDDGAHWLSRHLKGGK